MPSHVLGISCYYHDAAAALVSDGQIVAAAQEERFSRRKHDPSLPSEAIRFCLGKAGLDANQLDMVVFYDNPVLSLDRNLATFLSVAPRGQDRWRQFATSFLGGKVLVAREIRRRLGTHAPIYFTRHHLSHGASAFYPSPFEQAAILTVDGVGEWETTTIAYGSQAGIQPLKSVHFPHSLGLLYSAFTYFCGFRVNSGEYKLMGLAPYGRPCFVDTIHEHLLHLEPDGSFRLGLEYFGYLDSDRLTNERFDDLFGGGPRQPESRITDRETDLAASIQVVIQQAVLGLARHARELTDSPNLCMAGGVALNCVANGLLVREGLFDNIWIQPAAGDAGGALGAALLGAYDLQSLTRPVPAGNPDAQRGSLLGPSYPADDLHTKLDDLGCDYEKITDRRERTRRVAEHLAAGDVVALCSGPMEFGPRALGSRSILADPRRADTQTRLNLKVKFRESFRPFAPAVLQEACGDYFEFDGASPYMLITAPVRADRRFATDPSSVGSDDLLALVRQIRSDVPAITHIDFSARLQTVGSDSNPEFRSIIEQFRDLTGCPLVVNTSLNVRGEPIACTPEDALLCFLRTDIDILVVDDLIITGKPPRENTPASQPNGRLAADSHPVAAANRIDLFHRLVLVPTAERDGAKFASRLGTKHATGSAYQLPEATAAYYELETLDAIGDLLRQLWTAQGVESACGLIQPLLELAEELINERTDEDLDEVTPYIYTLF